MKQFLQGFIVTAVVIIFCIIGYRARIKPHLDEFNRLKYNQQYMDTTYLRKQGGTRLYGPKGFDNPWLNYDLRSWDCGKNWYVVNTDSNQFKIVGRADVLYPGLVEQLTSWDKMTEYVQKHGPIKLSDPEGLKVMKNAGFTVQKSK